jgi:hypothetical protein
MLACAIAVMSLAREPAWMAETWQAVHRHETANYTRYRGDGGRAVGPGHITAVVVRDANRICRLRGLNERFTLDCRRSEERSWRMFKLFCEHYGARDAEAAARIWNAGPDALRRGQAFAYWRKVKALMGRAA